MEESSKYQQMQDEMSRFEAEISGGELLGMRPVIGSATFGVVQQALDRVIPPPPPPPMLGGFDPSLMFPPMPQPPQPPVMVPASVQRLRHPEIPMPAMPMAFMGQAMGLPGPQVLPSKSQAVILSAAPKLYKKPKEDEDRKDKKNKESRKRKLKSPSPPPSMLPLVQMRSTPTPVSNPAPPVPDNPPKVKKEKKNRKVVRMAGGQVWEDVTLLDWPDDDFRMFCGDLGNDVTDELLIRTFSKYSSFQRAKVVRDKRTNKSRGFGFVSFKDPGDFIKSMKEMDGRYVGSRPIKLRKSTWRNRSMDVVKKKEIEKAALLSLLMTGNKS